VTNRRVNILKNMNYGSSQAIIQYLTAVVCRLLTADKDQETTAKVIRRCTKVVIPSANLILCNVFFSHA
jgi:uncharacterized membrane-anchored protein YjiN (DUF445 family)